MKVKKQQQYITAIIRDKRGRVLSVGKNSYVKTHPMQKTLALKARLPHKETLHAEIAAIIACRDLSRAYSIHVYRVLRDGTYGLAKPCRICAAAIEEAGIEKVFHT